MNKQKIRNRIPCLKTLFAYGLIMIMSFSFINNAATVSDNDGSAFITKAEFDSLKNNFQSQIDQYNSNIDSKIDSAISQYLAGIKVDKKFDQISLLNQLHNFHFTKNFNHFGKETIIGSYFKYWTWYSFYWGFNALSQQNPTTYGVGLRGGTNVTEPIEKTSGTTKSQYAIFGKSNYDESVFVPNYGVESYIYYYMLCMASTQSAGPSEYYSATTEIVGNEGTNTDFGINFYTGPRIEMGSYGQNASVAYSAFPMDTAWANYDASALPGNAMNASETCHYIKSDELMTLGDDDGTFDGSVSRENLYWINGSNRQTGSGTINLTVQKYKRKYNEIKYVDIMNDVVSQTVGERIQYYCGLPIFKASEDGEVSIKITPTNSAGENTTIAILDKPFGNISVGAGGIGVPDAECSFTDWDMASGTEYEIKFKVKKNTTYWIKACPAGTSSSTIFETSKIEVSKKDE